MNGETINSMILDKFKEIKSFIFDIDGVFTDGSLLISENGAFLRKMNVRDGFAVKYASTLGPYTLSVITGGGDPSVKDRMKYLGIQHYYEKVIHKKDALDDLVSKGIDLSHSLYIGDDVLDLSVLDHVGIFACPADAAPEVLARAHYISTKTGGQGVVRELVEAVLKSQGHWNF